jgi:hypothetical protein
MKKAVLVRVGIDQAYGHWNSPADEASGRFIYVPIPEMRPQHRGCERSYEQLTPQLTQFASNYNLDLWRDLKFPAELKTSRMHLDPDFEYLTYGDDGNRRGSDLRKLSEDDIVVFYAGLRSIHSKKDSLIYAIIGLFVVDEVVAVKDVPKERRDENAHTRRGVHEETGIIVRGIKGKSGRLETFLPIGEFRNRAYRVKKDILGAWGDLSVKDGFIQRSARPPRFLDAEKFYKWFLKQKTGLVQENNPMSDSKVIFVLLRRPNQNDEKETRPEPFYEFGSFGCTGCHKKNLMNPNKIKELDGARLAFAQGGPDGFKLIQLTPPVKSEKYRNCCELKWDKSVESFKYKNAPLLINKNNASDFPFLKKILQDGDRSTGEGQFSSYFRSRRTPLEPDDAREIIKIYSRCVNTAQKEHFASNYVETMHELPPKKDSNRAKTYAKFLHKANSAKSCRCKRKRKPC